MKTGPKPIGKLLIPKILQVLEEAISKAVQTEGYKSVVEKAGITSAYQNGKTYAAKLPEIKEGMFNLNKRLGLIK